MQSDADKDDDDDDDDDEDGSDASGEEGKEHAYAPTTQNAQTRTCTQSRTQAHK